MYTNNIIVGPASEQLPMLTLVTAAGLNIMRLNFSHATYEEAELRVTNLKLCKPGIFHLIIYITTLLIV